MEQLKEPLVFIFNCSACRISTLSRTAALFFSPPSRVAIWIRSTSVLQTTSLKMENKNLDHFWVQKNQYSDSQNAKLEA